MDEVILKNPVLDSNIDECSRKRSENDTRLAKEVSQLSNNGGVVIVEPASDNPAFEPDEPVTDHVGEERDFSAPVSTNPSTMKSKTECTPLVPDDEEVQRQQWSNPIEFLLSCIAMSVGLGNVWRFPFTAYENGGGAFLIPYITVLILIGRPMYFMELSLGQFASTSSVKVWELSPILKGVGYGQAIATFCVCSYYTILISLAISYFASSISAVLPWTVCDPKIQLDNVTCIEAGSTTSNITTKVISSAEQFFLHNVLKQKESIEDGLGLPDMRLLACLAVCYSLLFITMCKGVQSSGKAAYFNALFPYAVLITLLVKGATLPGAIEGILYYITPQWSALLDVKVWYAAVTQSFFSLSVGFGAIINYSSYNTFTHNVYRDAVIISIVDTFTSLLAGFTIFSILGNLAFELNVPVSEVIKSGAGLAFISYPTAIGKFEFAPQVFAVLFFLMLISLGMGSATGLYSSIIGILCDNFPSFNRTLMALGVLTVGFAIGLVYITPGGQHILTLVDFFGGGFVIYALAILEMIGIAWLYGVKSLMRDIKFMLGIDLGLYWKVCWAFIVPGALTFFFVYYLFTFPVVKYGGIPLPQAAIIGGWIIFGLAFSQVFIWGCHTVCMERSFTLPQKIIRSTQQSDEWGPKDDDTRNRWESFTEMKKP